MKDIQHIYIMGRGHSGSTILDALLGNGENSFSIGELVSGMPRTEDVCSCGVSIGECHFWNNVKQYFENSSDISWAEASDEVRKQAHIRSFIKTWAGFSRKENKKMKELNNEILTSIAEESGKSFLVESSKEFTRALFLAKNEEETRIIHLIRNPLSIFASNIVRIREGHFKFLRYTFDAQKNVFPFIVLSAVSWLVGNLLGEIVRMSGKADVLKVRYEDLCEDPVSELKRIESFTGEDLSGVIQKVEGREQMSIDHMIAGNRMRIKGEFVFKPEKKSERTLPAFYRFIGTVITWPLMLKYGYLNN